MLWFFMLLYAVSTMGKIPILTPVLSWVIIQGIKGRDECYEDCYTGSGRICIDDVHALHSRSGFVCDPR